MVRGPGRLPTAYLIAKSVFRDERSAEFVVDADLGDVQLLADIDACGQRSVGVVTRHGFRSKIQIVVFSLHRPARIEGIFDADAAEPSGARLGSTDGVGGGERLIAVERPGLTALCVKQHPVPSVADPACDVGNIARLGMTDESRV